VERLLLVVWADPAAPGPPEGDEDGRRLRQFARGVDALAELCPWIDPVRPGVCALPIKGPARYFGGEAAVLERVAAAVATVTDDGMAAGSGAGAGSGTAAGSGTGALQLGVAEGLFAADLAARAGVIVPVGGTREFLATWPVATLATPELCDLLPRLGLCTLGQLAAVPARDVLARFGAAGARCHRIARGLEGELPGYRVPGLAARLAALQHGIELRNHQPGFWGEASTADDRAAEVLTTLQRRLGSGAVTTAVPAGGRGPGDRARFITWRADHPAPGHPAPGHPAPGHPAPDHPAPDHPGSGARPPTAPWPGQLPPPAPARVAARGRELRAEVVDGTGAAVGVTARGMLTARPERASFAGGPWLEITGWSAPWPVEERWWSRARRRSARLQVTTVDGRAHLLMAERGQWWLAATYG